MRIDFEVPGEPRGKERHRNGKYSTYTPAKTRAYEEAVRQAFCLAWGSVKMPYPVKTPVLVRIDAFFKIPKSENKKIKFEMACNRIRPTKKPDVDNIAKVVMDALNGVAWKDDAQVVSLIVHKYYAQAEPYIHVILEDV